jgi:hypothetical protein
MSKRLVLLAVLFTIVLGFGLAICIDPYILTGYQTTEGGDVWASGSEAQALILFNFTSRGFVSANYPVEVTANIIVENNTLLSFLTGKRYVEMDIAGTYAYPTKSGPLGLYEGNISLQFDGAHSFEGTSNVIFPYVGNSYYYEIFAYNSPNEMATPIYTMDLTAPHIPPVFSIGEGSAARAQLEQLNRDTGLAIIALALSGLAIVAGIKWTRVSPNFESHTGVPLTDRGKPKQAVRRSLEIDKLPEFIQNIATWLPEPL